MGLDLLAGVGENFSLKVNRGTLNGDRFYGEVGSGRSGVVADTFDGDDTGVLTGIDVVGIRDSIVSIVSTVIEGSSAKHHRDDFWLYLIAGVCVLCLG